MAEGQRLMNAKHEPAVLTCVDLLLEARYYRRRRGALPRTSSRLRELALVGAKVRIEQLKTEIESLYDTFPELARISQVRTKPRKRSAMSAAARRAVSVRMKRYWAARRAGKNKKD